MRFIFVLLLCFVVTACTNPPNRPRNGMPMPMQTFAHIQPILLNVSRVEVVDDFVSTPQPADFKVSLVQKTKQYFAHKLKAARYAAPSAGALVVKIEDARVERDYKASESFVPQKLGLGGADVYKLKLVVLVEHHDEWGGVLAGKRFAVERGLSISEHSSLAEREQHQLDSIEAIFNTLDPDLSRALIEEMKLRAL